MTDKHQMWNSEELEQAVAADREAQAGSEETFTSFAENLPETESDAEAPQVPRSATEPQPGTTTVKTDAVARKMQAKMGKMKREFSQLIPRAVEHFFLSKGPQWVMPKDYKEMLTDSVESVFDVLDVQFAIQQYNVTLQSRLWVFLYPVAVLLAIFGLMQAKFGIADDGEPKEESKPAEATVN